MNTVQQTGYGVKALIYKLFDLQPEIDTNSSINERLSIMASERPTINERIKMGVLVVGNRGHRNVQGTGGIAKTSIIDHMANHASLYNHMPFCVRRADNDISISQQARYALRKEQLIDGVNHYLYYGYRLNVSAADITVQLLKVTKENGQEIIEQFIPGQNDLAPVPVELPTSGAVTTSNVQLRARAMLQVRFTKNDIEEYVNGAKILYGGDEGYAIMSEFGLCTQADRTISVPSTAGVVQFKESIGTQVYTFTADHRPVFYNSQEMTIEFDVGNSIPLLSTASIPTINVIGP